jgi:hypothetical protein
MGKTIKDFETRKKWLINHHKTWKITNGMDVAEEDIEADLNLLDDIEPAI